MPIHSRAACYCNTANSKAKAKAGNSKKSTACRTRFKRAQAAPPNQAGLQLTPVRHHHSVDNAAKKQKKNSASNPVEQCQRRGRSSVVSTPKRLTPLGSLSSSLQTLRASSSDQSCATAALAILGHALVPIGEDANFAITIAGLAIAFAVVSSNHGTVILGV